jgi:hypothetical protein
LQAGVQDASRICTKAVNTIMEADFPNKICNPGSVLPKNGVRISGEHSNDYRKGNDDGFRVNALQAPERRRRLSTRVVKSKTPQMTTTSLVWPSSFG